MEVVCLFPLLLCMRRLHGEHGQPVLSQEVQDPQQGLSHCRKLDCRKKKPARREFPTWEVSFWNFGNIEEKSYSSDEVHDNYPWSKFLQKKRKLSYSVRRQKQKKNVPKDKKGKGMTTLNLLSLPVLAMHKSNGDANAKPWESLSGKKPLLFQPLASTHKLLSSAYSRHSTCV